MPAPLFRPALEYLSVEHGVPARFRARVSYQGKIGVITRSSGDCVRVKFEGSRYGVPIHPTELIYLDADTDGAGSSSKPGV